MRAPAKATGDVEATGGKRADTKRRATEPIDLATDRPPRGRSGGGEGLKEHGGGRSNGSRPDPTRSKLPKPPQGHSGYEQKIKRKLPRRDGSPPRYTNQNARQLMLDAAVAAATERGYESMRISEVTDPIGVTRQAFYAHFRDKRHCLCEAIDPKLGAIERMAASLSESDPDSATKLAHALDDLISERFGSPEGTRGRLISAMIELLRDDGSFHKVRIGTLAKTAHVPPADFYRQFSGKQECFAVAYERLLDELIAEVRECPAEHTRHDVPALLDSLARALIADDERRRILIVEMAHLPDQAPPDIQGARKSALTIAIAKLLSESDATIAEQASPTFAAASIVELIRSAVLAGRIESLPSELAHLAAMSSQAPAQLSAA